VIEKQIIKNGKPEKSVMKNLIKNYFEVNESNLIKLEKVMYQVSKYYVNYKQ
jgi:hypothetical protein